VHLPAEHRSRDRAADDRRGNVVQERGEHEDHHQQHEPTLPVVGQESRQDRRNAAFLEMVGEERESEQQQQQVAQDHPLVDQVHPQPRQARTGLEPGEAELVEDDDCQARQRDAEGVVVEQRHASQGEGKQDEIHRHSENTCGGPDHQGTCEQPTLVRHEAHGNLEH
jgi:hypothetical protein